MHRYRPTWVEISKSAFLSNLRQIKSLVGGRVCVLAVLKADAYGHGAVPLAQIAVRGGAAMLGVSSLEEGLALRAAKIRAPILILGGIYPLENFSVALKAKLIPTVASLEAAQSLGKMARRLKKKAVFHLKVDTGMGRIGVSPAGAKLVLERIAADKNLTLAGVYTHFASADSDPVFTERQLSQFSEVKKTAEKLGFKNVLFHAANSAATLHFPNARQDMVRPGLALYGSSLVPFPKGVTLSPVLSWQTKVIFLKKVSAQTPISYGGTYRTKQESEIATLPVGYADGVPRSVSNQGFVLMKGKRCPIVGRVTMDHLMIDVTGLGADIGDKVMLIGRDGPDEITASDWSGWAGTIPYEIFCGISKRVPRVVTA